MIDSKRKRRALRTLPAARRLVLVLWTSSFAAAAATASAPDPGIAQRSHGLARAVGAVQTNANGTLPALGFRSRPTVSRFPCAVCVLFVRARMFVCPARVCFRTSECEKLREPATNIGAGRVRIFWPPTRKPLKSTDILCRVIYLTVIFFCHRTFFYDYRFLLFLNDLHAQN